MIDLKTYPILSQDERSKLLQEITDIGFSSNHNHSEISNFRLRDCIIRTEDLINRAIELGYKGVCCTDHEALSGHIRLLRRMKTLHDLKERYDNYDLTKEEDREKFEKDKDVQKEIKYIEKMPSDFKLGLGNEIYLVDNLEDVRDNYISGVTKFYHFILIAKDKEGYQQIKQISSDSAWKNWYKQNMMERVPTIKSEMEKIIGDNKGHIIAQNACLGGELDDLIIKYLESGNIEYKRKIANFIEWCINLFGKENFFLEIQPCVLKYDEDGNIIPHPQAYVNQFIFKLAKGYGLDVCVTTDSHYLKKEHRGVHEAYLKADDSEKSKNREVGDFYETTYLMEIEELVDLLSTHLTPEEIKMAFKGTVKSHKMIEEFDLSHQTIVPRDKKLPQFKIEHTLKEFYSTHEYIDKFAHSDDEQDQYMLYLIEQGMKDEWCDSHYTFSTFDENGKEIISEKTVLFQEKIDRINEELSSFWKISEKLNQKLSAYYVLVRGLVHEIMWKVSIVGVARGSVTGSFVCYLMKIIQINPLQYDLPFWRHSAPERPELPD